MLGIFGGSASPFDQYVDRATSEKNTGEDWAIIMDICDKVKESPNGPKDCLKSIKHRLHNENPRIVLQALTLLDACINNCGRKFLLEVASREFEETLRKLVMSPRTHHKISEKLRSLIKKWAEKDFKGDPQLSLIPALYIRLKNEGFDFDAVSDSPKKAAQPYSDDPNVVNDEREEDDIARAIQLSLQENGGSGSRGVGRPGVSNTGLYPNAMNADYVSSAPPMMVANLAASENEQRKARALYDFEAAEDNELTFKEGEIVMVLDSSDANWWKGSNHRGEGLFPANFVTLDFSDDRGNAKELNKRVSFAESVEVSELLQDDRMKQVGGVACGETEEEITGEVDEGRVDRLLHLLHETDPTGERPDDPEMTQLEVHINAMAPNIDSELEQTDRKHAQLERISADLGEALSLYHQLMHEMPTSMAGYYSLPTAAPGTSMVNYSTPPMPHAQMYSSNQTQYPPPQYMNQGGASLPAMVYPPQMNIPQMPNSSEIKHDISGSENTMPQHAHMMMPGYAQYPGHFASSQISGPVTSQPYHQLPMSVPTSNGFPPYSQPQPLI